MRRALVVVFAGVAAVALAWWLASLAGRMVVSIGGLSVEAPTALALAALGLVVFAALLLARLVGGLATLPHWWRARTLRRRRADGEAARTAALVAIAAGDARAARREAARARRLLGDGAETLMLAAEAERLGGDEAAAATLFARLADRPEAALIGLRGLFRQAVEREDWPAASALAARAEAAYPGGQWLREERERLAARTGDWRQALALSVPGADAAARAAYAVAAAEEAADPEQARALARQAFREHPEFVPAALVHARKLREAGREDRALEALTRAWTATPHPDLAVLALERAGDAMQRLRTAGRLVAGRAEHAESHLLLARLALEAGLTGDARRHARALREAAGESRRYWLLLADLEAAEPSEGGADAQSDALRRAARAEADPAWHCLACGATLPGWRPACPACHTPGRVAWGAAARLPLAREPAG